MRQKLSSIIVVAFTLLLTACAPKMNGLYKNPSFTYKTMTSQSLAVAGVGQVKHASAAQQNTYAEMFREAIINQRPALQIMPAGNVAQTMGHNYDRMLSYYAQRGVAANKYLKIIRNKTHNVRYVVFGRIISDSVSRHIATNANPPLYTQPQHPCRWQKRPCDWKRYVCYQDHNGVCRRKSHPVVKYNPDAVDYVTTRSINVGVKIYDLSDFRIVWSGSLAQSQSNANHYGEYYGTRFKHATGAILSNLLANRQLNQITKHATYPGAPGSVHLVSQILNGIAQNLPEKKKHWL